MANHISTLKTDPNNLMQYTYTILMED